MVWLWDLIFVFIIACIVFGAIYALAVRPTYSARTAAADDSAADIGCLWLVFLFFLFFLPIWGGGLWLEPIGPHFGGSEGHHGSYVFNFLIIAFIILIFFGVIWAVIPGTEFSWDGGSGDVAGDDDDGGWGAIFWIFIIIIILIIIFGYMWSSPHTMGNTDAEAVTLN
ncbi:MAG: hypothetical protein VX527_09940, partial [Planctomycetota bacterium]|nr:hypothetical protein [Planctomycetota bacterium]